MASGNIVVDVSFRLDTLSALMLSFVTFVGMLIHVYSVGYMQEEEGYGRYFAYMNLFMFAMLTLILAGSLPLHLRRFPASASVEAHLQPGAHAHETEPGILGRGRGKPRRRREAP